MPKPSPPTPKTAFSESIKSLVSIHEILSSKVGSGEERSCMFNYIKQLVPSKNDAEGIIDLADFSCNRVVERQIEQEYNSVLIAESLTEDEFRAMFVFALGDEGPCCRVSSLISFWRALQNATTFAKTNAAVFNKLKAAIDPYYNLLTSALSKLPQTKIRRAAKSFIFDGNAEEFLQNLHKNHHQESTVPSMIMIDDLTRLSTSVAGSTNFVGDSSSSSAENNHPHQPQATLICILEDFNGVDLSPFALSNITSAMPAASSSSTETPFFIIKKSFYLEHSKKLVLTLGSPTTAQENNKSSMKKHLFDECELRHPSLAASAPPPLQEQEVHDLDRYERNYFGVSRQDGVIKSLPRLARSFLAIYSDLREKDIAGYVPRPKHIFFKNKLTAEQLKQFDLKQTPSMFDVTAVSLQDVDKLEAEPVLRQIAQNFPKLRQLYLAAFGDKDRFKFDGSSFAHFSSPVTCKIQALAFLDLSRCSQVAADSLHHLAKNDRIAKSLLKLDISCCFNFNDDTAQVIADHFVNLEVLNLYGIRDMTSAGVKKIVTNLTRLIDISLAEFLSDEVVQALVEHVDRGVRRIDCSQCKELTDEGCRMLAEAFKTSLTDLTIQGCPTITDVGVRSLIMNVQNLTKLTLGHCEELTDTSLHKIVKNKENTKKMQNLDVSGCKKISNSAILDFAENGEFPELTCINLMSCTKLTDSGLRKSFLQHADRFPKLTAVQVSPIFTDTITKEIVDELKQRFEKSSS